MTGCNLCGALVEKIYIHEEDQYACPYCWEEYGEVH